jgi:hypothetical protein
MLEINASIICHKNQIWCTYRTDNLYDFDSKSVLSSLDSEFNPISSLPLSLADGNTAFEDVRLFSAGNNILATYTYLPKRIDGGWDWKYEIGCGYLDTISGTILSQQSLREFSTKENEKNYVPYIHNEEIFLITDFSPNLRILTLGKVNGPFEISEVYVSKEETKIWEFGEIRGGTPLLPNPLNDDGWYYGFIHSHLNNHEGFARYYFYTVVRINHFSKKIEYYKKPLPYQMEDNDEDYNKLWKFSNNQRLKVIFPMGIMLHEDGILISAGIDDTSNIIETYSWKQIMDFFDNE